MSFSGLAETNLENATKELQTTLAALKTADGQPIYAPEREAERIDAALVAFDGRVETQTTDLERAAKAAEAAMQSAMRDPIEQLSAADLAIANARRPFFAEDFDHLPLSELVSKAQVALAAGDKVSLVLAARYAARRVKSEDSAIRRGVAPGDPKAFRELSDLADQLVAAADPDRAAKEQAYTDATNRLNLFRSQAKATRSEYDGLASKTRASQRRVALAGW